MFESEWQKLKDEIVPVITGFESIAEYIVHNDDMEMLVELQQSVIELGTMLEEEYDLQGTEIIKLLENYCEKLADFWECKEESDAGFLKEDLRKIVPILRRSLKQRDLSIVVIIKNEGNILSNGWSII